MLLLDILSLYVKEVHNKKRFLNLLGRMHSLNMLDSKKQLKTILVSEAI